MSVTGWLLPTTATVEAGSGTWTNQNNVLADDGTEATLAIAAKNTTGRWVKGDDLGFDSAIPSGAVITKVEIRAEWRVNNAGGIGHLELQSFVGGAAVGAVRTNSAEPTTLTTDTYDITADRSWTRSDLLNASFDLKVRGRTGNSATDPSFRFDHIAAQVTYEEPATGPIAQTLPGLTQDANGLHGTVATGPIASTLPGLAQDATGERGPNTGPIAQSLPALSQDAAGTVADNSASGPIVQTLPSLTQSAAGERGPNVGSVTSSLPGLAQAITGERGPNFGSATSALPGLEQTATGERGPNLGPVTNVLPGLTQQVTGATGSESTTGPVVSLLPGLSTSVVARAVVTAGIGSVLPALVQLASQSIIGVPVEGPTRAVGPNRNRVRGAGTATRLSGIGTRNRVRGGGSHNEVEDG